MTTDTPTHRKTTMTTDTAGPGHNSVLNQGAQSQVRSIIERVERLEVEKSEIAEQIKEVFAEAKGNGFDPAILRLVIKHRKEDVRKRLEREAIFDLYLSALDALPLFERAEQPGDILIASQADPSILESEAATAMIGGV